MNVIKDLLTTMSGNANRSAIVGFVLLAYALIYGGITRDVAIFGSALAGALLALGIGVKEDGSAVKPVAVAPVATAEGGK